MDQHLSVVTLGVSELAASRRFYEQGLEWRVSPKSEGNIVFFQLGGIVLALYPRELLAEDANVPDDERTSFRGITLAHNVCTREEVDTVLQTAERAGGAIVKPAQEVFWAGTRATSLTLIGISGRSATIRSGSWRMTAD